ncbi:MAG: alpha/beta hydrolase [Chitinophagaceae bacterium]
MDGQSGFISVAGQNLHYIRFGTGPRVVVVFPGYGMQAAAFSFLAHEDYSVLSFDLPFSGQSECSPGFRMKRADLSVLLHEVANEYHVKKVGLAGFSIGARVCLCAFEAAPDKVSHMVLAAPDGLGKEWLYRFVTGTAAGTLLFKRFIGKGEHYIRLLQFMNALSIMPHHKFRFVMQYIRTTEARERLFNIWMSLSELMPVLEKIRRESSNRQVPVHILAGNADNVIPLRTIRNFAKRGSQVFLHLFERGHNLLQFDEVKGTFCSRLFNVTATAKP